MTKSIDSYEMHTTPIQSTVRRKETFTKCTAKGKWFNYITKKGLKAFCIALVMIFTLSGFNPVMARQPGHVGEVNLHVEQPGLSPLDENTFLTDDGILMVAGEDFIYDGVYFPEGDSLLVDTNSTIDGNYECRNAKYNLLPIPDPQFPSNIPAIYTDQYRDVVEQPQETIDLNRMPLPTPTAFNESEIFNSTNSSVMFFYTSHGHTIGSPPASHHATWDGTITLQHPNMFRPGFRFYGWSNSGWTWPAGYTFRFGAGSSGHFHFDAHWVPALTFEYRSSGHTSGSPPAPHAGNSNGSITFAHPGNLTRSGYRFNGWHNNGTWQPGYTFNWGAGASGHFVFQASWERIGNTFVTATFRGNRNTGGSPPPSQTISTPGILTLPNRGTLTRNGHTFNGWRTPGGANLSVGGTVQWPSPFSGTWTVDARWTINYQPYINNVSNNQQIPLQNLLVRWNAAPVAGVSYTIAMRDITNGDNGPIVLTERVVTTNSFTIPANHFRAGHRYRIGVSAGVGDQRHEWRWSERVVTVQSPQAAVTWPVPASHRITQRFSAGEHLGIDVGGSTPGVAGNAIVSMAQGTVVLAQVLSGYGQVIYIDHTNVNGFSWLQTRYGHLVSGSFRVGVNQSVSGGTHIANMGNTVAPGNAPVGVHLHFETRIIHRTPTIANANSTAIDPLANFFPNMRAAVSMHEYEEIIFDDISAMNANAAIARSSAELISYNYAETGEIFVSDTVFVLPNGNTTSLTLGNLSAFSSNEVISMGVSATNIQEIVDALGLEIVLEHLNGLGLGHLGLTLDGNGRVIYTR